MDSLTRRERLHSCRQIGIDLDNFRAYNFGEFGYEGQFFSNRMYRYTSNFPP